MLEWSDPPFNAGHWVPDMVEAAGGVPVLAVAGARSRRLTWEEIVPEPVDITVFMPCGFDLDGAVAQAPSLLARPEVIGLGRIFAVDANAFFSRPGPRVVDGVELLGDLFHLDTERVYPCRRSALALLTRLIGPSKRVLGVIESDRRTAARPRKCLHEPRTGPEFGIDLMRARSG